MSCDHLGLHLFHSSLHFLLERYRSCPPNFGFGLSDALISFGLSRLQLGSNILTDIHIRDIDGENFKRSAHIKTAF